MRNFLIIAFASGWSWGADCPGPELVVNPIDGELWIATSEWSYRSSRANEAGLLGPGFALAWESRVERTPYFEDGVECTDVLVHDRGIEGTWPMEFRLGGLDPGFAFPSPFPVPEASADALRLSAVRVGKVLRTAGDDGLLAEFDPYAQRLQRDPRFLAAEHEAQQARWRAHHMPVHDGHFGDAPARAWRVLVLPSWTLRYDFDGNVQVFDREGRLSRLLDYEGVVWRIDRGAAGRIARVEGRVRRTFQYDDAGRLAYVVREDGDWQSYRFDASGRLVRLGGPKHVLQFKWGGPGGKLLVGIRVGEKSARIGWQLDEDGVPRVANFLEEKGVAHHFIYERRGQVLTTTVRDDEGAQVNRMTLYPPGTKLSSPPMLAVEGEHQVGVLHFDGSFEYPNLFVDLSQGTDHRMRFDEWGRVVELHEADRSAVRIKWDPQGRSIELTNVGPARPGPIEGTTTVEFGRDRALPRVVRKEGEVQLESWWDDERLAARSSRTGGGSRTYEFRRTEGECQAVCERTFRTPTAAIFEWKRDERGAVTLRKLRDSGEDWSIALTGVGDCRFALVRDGKMLDPCHRTDVKAEELAEYFELVARMRDVLEEVERAVGP